MVYGSDNITLVFGNLKSGINYSLFYFSTVDDPRLSSRASRVQYLNVKTLVNVDYYLD